MIKGGFVVWLAHKSSKNERTKHLKHLPMDASGINVKHLFNLFNPYIRNYFYTYKKPEVGGHFSWSLARPTQQRSKSNNLKK